jgi:hypothetical protein
VRLGESVPSEGLELSGDVLDDPGFVAAINGAIDEFPELALQQICVLLAHRFAQHVGFRE